MDRPRHTKHDNIRHRNTKPTNPASVACSLASEASTSGSSRQDSTPHGRSKSTPTCRAVLAQHFPHAQRYDDVRSVGAHNLAAVDVVTAGFPCQDVSAAGKRAGLAGARTGLFWEVCRIIEEIWPQWLVLENVVGLLNSNAGKDFGTVVQALAQRGYVGCWRVLDSQYFGVAQGRRRVFLVAGLGTHPPRWAAF